MPPMQEFEVYVYDKDTNRKKLLLNKVNNL